MDRRRALLVALSFALFAVILGVLVGGIDDLEVGPGRVLPAPDEERLVLHDPPPIATIQIDSPDVLRILIPIALALLVASVAMSIRDRRFRPTVALGLLLFAILALTLHLIGPFGPADRPVIEEEPSVVEGSTAGPSPDAALRVETLTESAGAIWPIAATAILAAVLIALLTVPVVSYCLRRRRSALGDGDASGIEEIAADAVREIDAGADPIGVVQRCYARMLHALSKRAGLDPIFRTPREFAVDLREAGFAHDSVDALTEMFELVRYGARADGSLADRARRSLAALQLRHDAG